MEQQIYQFTGLVEFYLNEAGSKVQGFISRILPGSNSSQLESMEPDVEAIQEHMEEMQDE